MTDTGAINLCNAIYERAAQDYETALIRGDVYETKLIKNFLLSGAYQKNNSAGIAIIYQMPKEIEAAKRYVIEFLESGEKQRKIGTEVVYRTLAKVVKADFKRKCKTFIHYGQPYIKRGK